MKHTVIISCLLFLLVTPLIADCPPSEKKALEELDRAWGEASVRGDRAALEQIYASDYMTLTAGNSENRAEIIESTVGDARRAQAGPPPAATQHDFYMINCTPVTATITHRNVGTSSEGQTFYSRSIHVMEKRNGRWQAVASTGHGLNDAGAISYLEHEWNDADVKGDSAWMEKNFAGNLTSISSRTGKLMSKSEEIADLKSRKAVPLWNELSDLNVRTQGDTAVVTGVNRVKGKEADGKEFDRRVAFTDVWVKRDGRWQVIATQGTEVR